MKHFTFILNYLEIGIELPYKIDNNYILRKASLEEIDLIYKYLNVVNLENFDSPISPDRFTEIYKYNILFDEKNRLNFHSIQKKSDWKMYVIETVKKTISFSEITQAAYLTTNSLTANLSFQIDKKKGSRLKGFFSEVSDFYDKQEFSREYLNKEYYTNNFVDKSFVTQFEEILNLINRLDKNSYLRSILWNIRELSLHRFTSVFKPLIYFVLWEQLLAHHPTGNGDSITKQLKSKIQLLSNRMTGIYKINLAEYLADENTSLDKIISVLYSYRSSLIHSGKCDFQSTKYKIFSNLRYNVIKSIEEITKKIIIEAMRDSNLVRDLKNC